jgi:hypothetical protein
MCTWKMSPLCRSIPEPVISTAGVVGDAPFRYRPVELGPSPLLLYRSNFTATLFVVVRPYARFPPAPPSPAVEPFCRVKVSPSAVPVPAVVWKLKSVVKF